MLFGIGGLGAGGSEAQLVELLTRVHPHRIEAVLVTLAHGPAGPRLDRVRAAGIEHHVIGTSRAPLPVRAVTTAGRYRRVIRAVRPDAVYAWLEETSLFMVPLAHREGIPVVVARRNVSGARSERFAPLRAMIRRAEATAEILTVNSGAGREAALARGIRAERIRAVANGHETGADAPPLPGGDPVTLGYLARFRPEKGHLRLIETLRRLPPTPAWRVLLGGEGPLDADIRDAVRGAGLEDRVVFEGQVDDPRAFWARCDVGVLLSDHEGSPNALIEAALAGRPLVGTRVGGTPEVVHDGAGFLADPADAGEAARALARLVADAELRAECGRRARENAAARFGVEAMVEGHVGAIDAALGAQPATGPQRRRHSS